MNSFTIRDIENLSGIKAHTLRVWEQRYGIIQPQRKESKHRLYNADDLKQILRISNLYHQGYKISKIAEMSLSEIAKHTLEIRNGNYDVLVNQLMEASIDMDEDNFRRILDNIFHSLGAETGIIQVIYPFLHRIGLLWMTGNIIPAQEHFSTNLIRNRLYQLIDGLPRVSNSGNNRIILFCPSGEFHEIPLLFIQYLLKKNRKSVVNFGSDTSSTLIKTYLEKNKAQYIFVHLITNFTYLKPREYLQQLLKEFPEVQIIASGPVFRETELESQRLVVLRSLEEMLAFSKS